MDLSYTSSNEPHTLKPFCFNSSAGKELIQAILALYVPYIPHDYHFDGLMRALDSIDLVVVAPTGSGKTGFMSFFILVVRELKRYPQKYAIASKYIRKIPVNPLLLAICPTNYLEYQLEETMLKLGLVVLVINSQTIREAIDKNGPSLWKLAQEDLNISMIIMSPEELTSKGFETILKVDGFWKRVCALGIDEIHLLLTWGAQFRKPFQQIGIARSRLPDSAVLIAVTATLQGGQPLQDVLRFLGLQQGQFHLIRRSNQRHDIQILFREITSPINGRNFPELSWVLTQRRITVIFCRTINLSHRIREYLYYFDASLHGDPRTVTHRIRMYNALDEEENKETTQLLKNGKAHVVIATSTLSIGVDVANIQDVIIFGDPEDENARIQMIGRIRPQQSQQLQFGEADVPSAKPRGIIYFFTNAQQRAEKAIGNTSGAIEDLKSAAVMDRAVAQQFLAPCHIDEQDRQYDNPTSDSICICPTCKAHPPPPRTIPCDCSGCLPEKVTTFSEDGQAIHPKAAEADSLPKKHQRLTKVLRSHGTKALKVFRMDLFREADRQTSSLFPPEFFFTDEEIKSILDHFALIKSPEDVKKIVGSNIRLVNSYDRLYEVLERLHVEFDELRENAKRERKEAKAK